MASDVLVDSRGFIRPHMSTDSLSSSSDDDAVNTDFARVHFGPLKSPEKKFAVQGDAQNFLTPVRRSARLSPSPAITSHESVDDMQEDQEPSGLGSTEDQSSANSREGTPLHLDGMPLYLIEWKIINYSSQNPLLYWLVESFELTIILLHLPNRPSPKF